MTYFIRKKLILLIFSVLGTLPMIGQISISFTTTDDSGCGSLSTSFCSTSTSNAGPITSYLWDICGVTSSLECPAAILTNQGGCTVCLTVTDAAGNTETKCEVDFVTVYAKPEPLFSANGRVGCVPFDVEFEDMTTLGSAPIVEWTWGLGGMTGVMSTTDVNEIITSNYVMADEYGVSLTVQDANGCTGTYFVDNYIEAKDKTPVRFKADQTTTCTSPFVVQFTNTTNDPSLSYTWDFGNGQTFEGETPPPVTYMDQGAYTVSVSAISNELGCATSASVNNFITIGSDVSFNASAVQSCIGEIISFEDTTVEPADSIRWDFGDGTTSTIATPSVIYDNEGCYTITLERFINNCREVETLDCINVLSGIDVDYTIINKQGCQTPHTSTFSNQTPGFNSYVWEVLSPTGTVLETYSLPNPTHTFTDFGIYPIRLTVTNAGGCVDSRVVDSVRLQRLNASIPAQKLNGCAPYTFTISDNTVTSSPITSWEWELITDSGVINSTSMAPTFTLVDTGCADIKLTVLNASGCMSTKTYQNAACAGMEPQFDFIADPLVICGGLKIDFEATATTDVTKYSWDFNGDGTFDAEGNPVRHEYQDTGFFDVALMLEQHGCFNTLKKEDYITVRPPIALFEPFVNCGDDLNISLFNKSVGADSVIWTIELPTGNEVFNYNITEYDFPDFGTYNTTLRVFNFETGCSDVITIPVKVIERKVAFIPSKNSGCAPLEFILINQSPDIDSFVWKTNIGELLDTLESPLIRISEPGIYSGDDIQLIVFSNRGGCPDTTNLEGEIIVNEINPEFSFAPVEGCAPLDVQFIDESTNQYGNNIEWLWDVGTGEELISGQTISYTYQQSGIYDVELTVSDDLGCTKSVKYLDTIQVFGPSAQFVVDSITCISTEYTIENTTIGTASSYSWDFGNGTTSTEESPTLSYDTQGTYTICLTATDLDCSSTYCQDMIVGDPLADFEADNTYAFCPPLVVNFTNKSSGAEFFEWDFGDATGTSNLESPAHVYNSPGTYDVTLISYNTPDCADTITIKDYITIDGPVGGFDVVVDGQCNPVTATFTGSSLFDYKFIWDFGNGEVDSTLVVSNDVINYIYDVPGMYIPKLILVDDAGCESIFTGDSIIVTEMAAIFTTTDSVMCNQIEPITLKSISESYAPIVDYHWYIPGGTPSESFADSIEVTFTSSGTYDVTLVIENEFCKDSVTIANYIRIGASPTANFTTQDSAVCFPDSIFFIDQSIGDIVSWEWGLGDSIISNIQNPSGFYQPQNDIPIQLIVENTLGCKDSVVRMVDVLPPLDVMAVEDYEICTNGQIQLFAEVALDSTQTYSWEASPYLSCTDCLSPIANPPTATTFNFTVSNGVCRTTVPVLVNVRPEEIPVISISGTESICLNEVTQLTATGGEGPFAYQWGTDQPGLSCYSACSNPIASPLVTTTYYLTVTNESGCSAVDSFTVTISNEFVEIATEDQLLCEGDSVQLSVSEGTNPVWFPGTGLSCVNCPNPFAFPNSDIVYTVTVENVEGCSMTDTVYIDVVGLDEIDAGGDITICNNDVGFLEGFGEGVVSWTPDFLVNDNNTFTPNVSPLTTTTYYMHVDNGACILTDSVTVEVATKTDVYVLDKRICKGDGVELTVVGDADTYQWFPETGLSLPMISNPIASPMETTTYQVIATNGGCEPDTAFVDVIVNPLPDANLPPIYYFYPGQDLSISVDSDIQDKSSFTWLDPDGLSCTICDDPIFEGDSTATYNVIIRDPINNCPDTLTTILIPIDECNGNLISVPNVFSPNGDDINDIVYPYSTIIDRVKTFKVYSRWGEVLYEANDFATNSAAHGWDGTYQGNYMNPGVYVYYIEATCYSGDTVVKHGDITIFR